MGLALSMPNILSKSKVYLVWLMNVLEFSHNRHLKPIGHDLAKLFTKRGISRAKNDIINIYLAYK
jgi:hypothetical protein